MYVAKMIRIPWNHGLCLVSRPDSARSRNCYSVPSCRVVMCNFGCSIAQLHRLIYHCTTVDDLHISLVDTSREKKRYETSTKTSSAVNNDCPRPNACSHYAQFLCLPTKEASFSASTFSNHSVGPLTPSKKSLVSDHLS